MHNPFSLKNKTILVTGASSGIGESIAIESSKMNANMIILGRNENRLQNTYSQLSESGQHEMKVFDLRESESINSLVDSLPLLDGLVLNAGILKTVPVKNIKEENIIDVFETNILSSIRLVQRLLKKKKINANASIVFISSLSVFQVKKGNSLYSASKGAVNSFAKALALELAHRNIRVNIIQPGYINTRVLDAGIITEEQLQEFSKKYPLGYGNVEDIAYPTIYLLSNAAKWVTGSVFTIDGGGTLQ